MALIRKQASDTVEQDQQQPVIDYASLKQQFFAPDASTRRWAVRDMINCPDASDALIKLLQREQDSSVREIILTTLTQIGDEVAVAGLVSYLRSEDVALRNEAIEAMKQLPGSVAPIMGNLLKDPDPDVRIFAVNILESLRHGLVEQWLHEVIVQDQHVNVCATAVDLLGEVGTSFSRDALERLKARFPEEPYITFAANLALKRISGT